MNSALKPSVIPSTGSAQSPQQHNKPMHPQGAASFGQPSGHVSQNPYPNMNAAHNHPNSQQNHFGIVGATPYNMGAIPPSNHPVASMNQTSSGQQIFGGGVGGSPKTLGYAGAFQGNTGHQQQNQTSIPPISQTLPATTTHQQPLQLQQQSTNNVANSTSNTAQAPEVQKEQPQSNGTSDSKAETQENHVASQIPSQQSLAQAEAASSPEKPIPASKVQEEKTPPVPEVVKPPEESKATEPLLPTPVPETVTESPAVEESECTSASNTETNSSPSQTKSTEETSASKVDEVETDKSLPAEEAPKAVEAKSPVSENSTDTKKSLEKDKVPSEQVTQEKSNEETKVDVDKADEEPQEPAKIKPKDTAGARKEATPVKATTQKTTPARKPRTPKVDEPKTPKAEVKTPAVIQKSPNTGKAKRQRIRTQHYQSPLPEIEIITKISSSTPRSKNNDDRLIYFYKNEFLAVRNAEGSFYLCQAIQNIYKSSTKIKIRWLSQDKNDKTGEIYTPDFYDLTDFDCILTSLDLSRVDKGKYRLSPAEKERTDSILKRCLAVEKGEISTPSLSEEHPDGLDLSLYKDEEQLKKKQKGTKRKSQSPAKSPAKAAPVKKTPQVPKVRKVEPVKTAAKKVAATPKKSAVATPAKKAPPAAVAAVTTSDAKKTQQSTSSSGRLSRGKRKSETKSSPVVDQKKAKVLAKIGKKIGQPCAISIFKD